MGKKADKSTIKFMKKGLLTDTIKRRKKSQKIAKGTKKREEKKAKRIEAEENIQKSTHFFLVSRDCFGGSLIQMEMRL
jgi:hypothetical protein